jgi:hypothetical protein
MNIYLGKDFTQRQKKTISRKKTNSNSWNPKKDKTNQID